jgi:hypothetical protein
MTKQTNYICNVCKKPIEKGHQELYMATINVKGYSYKYDDESENWSNTYHVHNDFSKHCLRKVLEKLVNE